MDRGEYSMKDKTKVEENSISGNKTDPKLVEKIYIGSTIRVIEDQDKIQLVRNAWNWGS